MKRIAVAVAAMALLVVGTAAAAMAAPFEADDTPQTGWTCPAWTGTFGNYDPATNPSITRIAEKLGMSAADLGKELQDGTSVAEIAKAKNVDLQAVVDALVAPQKDLMAVRVKYGFLTQEQADLAVKNMVEVMKARLQLSGYLGGMASGMTGRGMTGGGMMDGFGPGMMGRGVSPEAVAPSNGQSWGPGTMGRGGMMGGAWNWQNRSN